MSKPLQIVAVVGCQRSGTTLTGQILGAHPQAVLIDEDDGLYSWFAGLLAARETSDDLLEKIVGRARRKYAADAEKFVSDSGGGWHLAEHVSHLILKAPNLTYAVRELACMKPQVRVIYPVRDPRSVVASMTRLSHVPMVENQIRLIRKYPALAERFAPELAALESPETALHVKRAIVWRVKSGLQSDFASVGLQPMTFHYEDLVSDVEAFGRRLCLHARLKFSPEVLRHERHYVGLAPGRTPRQRPVDNSSVQLWQDALSEAENRLIMDTAGKTAASLGYGVTQRAAYNGFDIPDAVIHSPIILTGRGGSGTRMLSHIVAGSGVFLGNKLNASADSVEWVDVLNPMAIEKVAQQRNRPELVERWGQILRDRAFDTLSAGVWNRGQLWGWKLPETMLVAECLLDIFQQAKLIHLVRHPLTSSFRRTHKTSRRDNPVGAAVLEAAYASVGLAMPKAERCDAVADNAVTWRYQVGNVAALCREPARQARCLQVRYEDLCNDRERTAEVIANFLEVPPERAALARVDPARMAGGEWSRTEAQWVWSLCEPVAVPFGYGISSAGDPVVRSLEA